MLAVIVGLGSCVALSVALRVGGTIVDRKVNENSYQKSETHKSEIAAYSAQLAEIEGQLARTDLDQSARAQLEGQAKALRQRIKIANDKLEGAALK